MIGCAGAPSESRNRRVEIGAKHETESLPRTSWQLGLLYRPDRLTQDAIELRFLCFEDGNECEVYADLLRQFSEINPDIKVAVDASAEEDMLERLQAAFDADAAYDIARSKRGWKLGNYVNLRPLLGEALTTNFRPVYFEFLRVLPDDRGIYAFPDALGVVAPFVNVSLFEHAA